MRTITLLALLVISAMSPAAAWAATPGPSSSATATRTPAATATPTVTASAVATLGATSTPTPTPTALPSPSLTSFTLSGRFVVDANGNGVADPADAAPVVAYLNLVPWSTADALLSPETFDRFVNVPLYSAPGGSFAFDKLPADSYTLEMFWPTGFVTKGASPAVPTILRAAFSVTGKGEVLVPDPLPKVWPGSLEPFVPDEPILGRLPDPILLKKLDNSNLQTVPVFDAGAAGPPPVGRVDVSAVLRSGRRPAVQLPSTGAASPPDGGWLSYALLAGAAITLIGLAAALVRRPRA